MEVVKDTDTAGGGESTEWPPLSHHQKHNRPFQQTSRTFPNDECQDPEDISTIIKQGSAQAALLED